MKTLILTGLIALVAHSAFAQKKECRVAEEELADVSVKIVQAYNTQDLDKAQGVSKQAIKQIERGENAAKQCGCQGAASPAASARQAIEQTANAGSLSDFQNDMAAALQSSESARMEAEKCWRGEAVFKKT